MKSLSFFIIIISIFLFWPQDSEALTDLSINVSDISFSKTEPLEGDRIRIFARIFNFGDKDVYGFVVFKNNKLEMVDPQPISVKINTYDDVFIDWIAQSGTYDIKAEIIGTNPKDENPDNNVAIQENYSVDLDTDGDKIGNTKDQDDDNDGFSDEEELFVYGTDPLVPNIKSSKKLQASIINTDILDSKKILAIHLLAFLFIIIFFFFRRPKTMKYEQ